MQAQSRSFVTSNPSLNDYYLKQHPWLQVAHDVFLSIRLGVLPFKAEEINFRKKMRDNEFGTPGQLGKGPVQSCRNSTRSEHRYKNMLHLWEFLLELLADESCRSIICWRRREEGEFELLNQQEVAKRWGILKQRGRMDYGKLSRALRLYYRDGIITKVLPLKKALCLSINVFCKGLFEDTVSTSPSGDETAILCGHSSQAKVWPFARQRQ